MARSHSSGPDQAVALQRMQRLATLGLLSGSLAHEFNNIFTTMINTARLALEEAVDERQARMLERIVRSAKRAAELSNAILGYARGGEEEQPGCDPTQVVDDVLVLTRKELQKHRVRAEVERGACPALAISGAALQQVLLNLVLNACQAMAEEGGVLRIQVRRARSGRGGEIVIADTGTGIPRGELKRVFEPFYTTKRPAAGGLGGSGLGLAVCRELVLAAGGSIRVESKLGAGTRFIIRLPAARGGARRVA